MNVFKPVMANALLQSIRLLSDGAQSFTDNCVIGIRADREHLAAMMRRSLMLVTALAPKIGYDAAAKIAKSAHANRTELRDEALKSGVISAKDFDQLVQPEKMIGNRSKLGSGAHGYVTREDKHCGNLPPFMAGPIVPVKQ